MSSPTADPARPAATGSVAERTRGAGPSTTLALVLAVPVHLLTLAVAAAGVALLWPGTDLFQKILGVLCLGTAVALRPTPPGPARDVTRVTAAEVPETTALVRDVAEAVGGPVPARIEVTGGVRADLELTALGSGVVQISAPVWLALTGPERVALLGHEIGHLGHGARWTRRVVDGAAQTLCRWETITAGGRVGADLRAGSFGSQLAVSVQTDAASDEARRSILSDIATAVLWPVRASARAYRRLLLLVARPGLRRQAQAADRAAVRAAGAEATRALLEVLLALPDLEASAQRAVTGRSYVRTAMADWQVAFDTERRRRVQRDETDGGPVDDHHLPTKDRIAAIAGLRTDPTVQVTAERWCTVDAELADAIAARLKRLSDDYLYPR